VAIPVKIALVSPYDYAHPGGVVIHIASLHEQFTKMGHDVRIITPYSGSRASLDNPDIITLGKPVPLPSGGSIARAPLSPMLSSPLRAILEREKFDIIHLHEPLGSTLTILTLRVSNTINVGTFHACHSSTMGYRIISPFVMKWFNKLHGKIAVSKPAMDFIGKHFPSEYTIIPNGIDVEHFSTAVSPIDKFSDGKLNILFVGRLEKRKGLRYLLGAYKIVKQELPNSRLIVVGPGKNEKYKKLVEKENMKDVFFTGYVPNEELHTYYQTADVFCTPATGEESFGIILLEAMAASKPIVASAIEGYSSVMSHGVEGLMVPPRDEQALASALIQLLSDEPLRREMGARGTLKAEECSWPNVAKMVIEYYMSLLNGA
jgi:phosphatidylinositol alpha-mannosyltransferase